MEYACLLNEYPWQHGLVTLPVWSGKTGDLLYLQDQYALHLWTTLAEQFMTQKIPGVSRSEILEPSLLTIETVTRVHTFVSYRFTSYPRALQLWLWDDMIPLLARKPKSIKKKPATPDASTFITLDSNFHFSMSDTSFVQQLVVFPDLWTMLNLVPDHIKELPHVLLLHSQSTPKQCQEAFRACKMWTVTTIITTWSQIFHDRTYLSHCLVVAPHTRYYKQQQDPRYHTVTVLQELCVRRGIVLEMTGVEELRVEK
jgi:hypothetical protein